MPEVKIVNHSPYPLPAYETAGSAGVDLRANLPEPITLAPMERRLVPTGLFIELPEGYEAQVRPRSGLALRHGLSVVNTPGTIDSDYRGEIGIPMINISQEAQTISPGDRVAQMVVAPVVQVTWKPVTQLNDSSRGTGGFGSTGR
ncbi:MAG: dUTP diphosphatase [Saprospiraceae bacterium]|jgi:dUTP pyrophosphatase